MRPTWNVKCILFTAALAGGYWYLPVRNKWVLLALLYFPYLAMAWYDDAYACDRPFGATFLHHFYAWGKGERYAQAWRDLDPNWRTIVTAVDLALLVGLIALLPAFLSLKSGSRARA